MSKIHKNVIDDALKLIDSEKSEQFLDELHGNLIKSIERTRGLHQAIISTLVQLSESEKKQMEFLVTKIFQKKIEIVYKIDKNIFGGFKIEVGDWKLDATVNNDLTQIKNQMLT